MRLRTNAGWHPPSSRNQALRWSLISEHQPHAELGPTSSCRECCCGLSLQIVGHIALRVPTRLSERQENQSESCCPSYRPDVLWTKRQGHVRFPSEQTRPYSLQAESGQSPESLAAQLAESFEQELPSGASMQSEEQLASRKRILISPAGRRLGADYPASGRSRVNLD